MRPLANSLNWGFGRSLILFMRFCSLEGINPGSVRLFEPNQACNYPYHRIKFFNMSVAPSPPPPPPLMYILSSLHVWVSVNCEWPQYCAVTAWWSLRNAVLQMQYLWKSSVHFADNCTVILKKKAKTVPSLQGWLWMWFGLLLWSIQLALSLIFHIWVSKSNKSICWSSLRLCLPRQSWDLIKCLNWKIMEWKYIIF